MASKLEKEWDKPITEPLSEKIKDAIQPSAPLKQRIFQVIHRLKLQSSKLDLLAERLREKDRRLFEKVVDSYVKHDMDKAKIFANETANTRKALKLVENCKSALESVVLRLETVQSVGDVAVAISGAISVIQSVRGKLSGIFPELDKELVAINENLSGLLYETAGPEGMIGGFEVTTEESEAILKEAVSVAESRAKEKFSEIPIGTGLNVEQKQN
ncbi:MAG: Snf7 family protein [Thermoproteota archaeon]|jgi:division protein CdvB (Snf7/Vps24/ESCRT-III family)|nr:Snf7 family protein [Thermoproteota archaeon]